MKHKTLLFIPLVACSLSSCATGVHYAAEKYFTKSIEYTENFKILQLTDTHLGDKDDLDLHYRFMDKIIEDAEPDMIIVTGDLFTFASKGTAISFFNFLEKHHVPWTVTFGNHDEQCYFSIDWMTDYLNNYGKHCYFKDIQDDDVTGNANFVINLTQGGVPFEQLIVMDSNRYHYGTDYCGYDYFHEDQIKWYQRVVDPVVPSLMFYHIPLPEIDVAYEEGKALGLVNGVKREKSCPPEYNSGFFKVIKEVGSTDAMFFGHDHINNFNVEYQGITFSYGLKSTNRIYYDDDMTGGQLITLHPDHSFSLEYLFHTYKEVM